MTNTAAEHLANQEAVHPWHSRIIELYTHPSRYFANDSNLGNQPTIVLAAVLMGIAGVINKIDEKIIQFELGRAAGHPNKGLENIVPWVVESWSNYWLLAAVMGLVGSAFLWYLGGWWYKKRLQWSGAADACPVKAKRAYVTQELVVAAPVVVLALIQTVLYSNYREAWQAQEIWSSSIMIFVFWSCWVSYVASTTAFPTSRPKARIWFLILPVLLNVFALGVIGGLYAFFAGKGA